MSNMSTAVQGRTKKSAEMSNQTHWKYVHETFQTCGSTKIRKERSASHPPKLRKTKMKERVRCERVI